MKSFFAILLLFVTSCTAFAFQYPTRKQVATKLYANYSVPEYGSDTTIEYQKKREGWFVVKSVYDTVKEQMYPAVTELFWSSTSGKYNSLKKFRSGITPGFSQRVARDNYSPGSYDFERCPYYGYTGWYTDVILDFGNPIPANDTLAEGIARAYSAMASAYMGDQYGWSIPGQSLLPEKERLDLYVSNAKKSISYYDVIRKRNPHFEVLIGEITTKYANEIMAHYEALSYYNRESEMNEYFKEDLYDPFMRGVAKGMLENCAQNGILFTSGDNDTFPMWYMQWIKGIRKDVVVMNMSLMNLDYYLDRYRSPFRGTTAVKFTLATKKYEENDMFLNLQEDRTAVGPSAYFNGFTDNTEISPGDTFSCFHAGRISVMYQETMFKQYELLKNPGLVILDIDKQYLLQSDMAVLDILLSNYETRGVYFSCTSSEPSWLTPYLFREGMVQRFIPALAPDNQYGEFYSVASAKIASKQMQDFLALDTTCMDRVNAARWILNCKVTSNTIVKVMTNSGDSAGAIALLNKLYDRFPLRTWKPDPTDYYSMDAYYDAGDVKGGNAVGYALINEASFKFSYWKELSRMTEDQNNEKRRWLQVMEMTVQAARKHAQIDVAQKADALWKENK